MVSAPPTNSRCQNPDTDESTDPLSPGGMVVVAESGGRQAVSGAEMAGVSQLTFHNLYINESSYTVGIDRWVFP